MTFKVIFLMETESVNGDPAIDAAMKGNVLLDFYADWCAPCKAIAPLFDRLSREHKEIKFMKVNVDQRQEVADMFTVRSIPTILFLKEGEEVDRAVGTLHETTILDKLQKAFR